jgi:hypothetical protein
MVDAVIKLEDLGHDGAADYTLYSNGWVYVDRQGACRVYCTRAAWAHSPAKANIDARARLLAPRP